MKLVKYWLLESTVATGRVTRPTLSTRFTPVTTTERMHQDLPYITCREDNDRVREENSTLRSNQIT